MYFHLIWIKEKNWNNYDLNLILRWWDEDFIRKFLSNRWVVIVSINEYTDDPNAFWDIVISLTYSWTEIQLIAQWQDLSESMSFFVSLWLRPLSINFLSNPIAEEQMKNMLDSIVLTVEEENKKIKQQEEYEEMKEKKKYEETWIKDWLRIINSNIDHIEQVLKAGHWVLSSHNIKELENYLAEMKKIRLWTNFNKMTSLMLDSHILLKKAENEIFEANKQNKFLIDKNSSLTNIDVLREYLHSSKVSEQAIMQPAWLSTYESITNILGKRYIFLKLLRRDMVHYFDNYSVDDFLDTVMKSIEIVILWIIIAISLSWLFGALMGFSNLSLYLLPAMGRLWVLVYLFNGLKIKWLISKIVYFFILVWIYWYWLTLLLNTFAL